MSPDDPPAADAPPESGPPGLPADQPPWDRIELALRQQLDLLAQGKVDELDALAGQVGVMLQQALACVQPGPEVAHRVAKLAEMHRQLALAVAQRREELAQQLSRLRDGRSALRAYGEN